MRKGQFISFDNGLVQTLDSLVSFKENSREQDPVTVSGKVIAQPYSLINIANTVEQNTYHKVAIDTVSIDASSNGYTITKPDEKTFNQNTHDQIIDYIESLDIENISYEAVFEKRLYGNMWIEVIKDKYDGQGAVKSMNVLQGKYMYKTIDDRIYLQTVNGNKRYFKVFGNDDIDVNYKTGAISKRGSISEDNRATEVYFSRSYNPNSLHYGLPIAVNIMTVIIGDLKRGENNLNFFLRGGVPKFLITITGDFANIINQTLYDADPYDADTNPEGVRPVYMEEWLEQEMKVIESQNNPNGALVLTLQNDGRDTPINVQFQQISSTTGEASHREYRTDNRDEILAAHQVPVYRLGIAETGSLGQTNIVEQNKIYNRKVVKPLQNCLQILFNKIIAHQFGADIARNYKFKFNEIDLEDNVEKLEADIKQKEFWLKEYTANVITLDMYLELTGRDIKDFESSLEESSILEEALQSVIDNKNGLAV